MKKFPSVLICAPQHVSKDYCFKEWAENVKSFTYPNFKVYLADNSDNRKFSRFIQKNYGFESDWIDPSRKTLDQVLAKGHEACRQYAIRNKFSYILHLETDVIPPRNIIELLLSAKKDIISAPYHILQGRHSRLMIQMAEKNANENFKNTFPLLKDLPEFLDGSIKQVYAAGLGCTLIKRKVFYRFAFRSVDGVDLRPDSLWAYDIFNAGLIQWVDTRIICGHRNQPWGKYGIDF